MIHRRKSKEINEARGQFPAAYSGYFDQSRFSGPSSSAPAAAARRIAAICETLGWSRAGRGVEPPGNVTVVWDGVTLKIADKSEGLRRRNPVQRRSDLAMHPRVPAMESRGGIGSRISPRLRSWVALFTRPDIWHEKQIPRSVGSSMIKQKRRAVDQRPGDILGSGQLAGGRLLHAHLQIVPQAQAAPGLAGPASGQTRADRVAP